MIEQQEGNLLKNEYIPPSKAQYCCQCIFYEKPNGHYLTGFCRNNECEFFGQMFSTFHFACVNSEIKENVQ